jgi:16S rRNA (adenine1518-N6/adenine1519-N6)-dimethyltransferase
MNAIENVKFLLRKYGITPKKSLSQFFLVSQSAIETAASYAQGVVLEIGPGCGVITVELAKRADKVIAVEKDKGLVTLLRAEYDFENVEVIHGDITQMDLPTFDRVISNIPYHLSSPITSTLLEHKFELGILFYQKEFAQRLTERPPSPRVSRLSVMAHMNAECVILHSVPKTKFYPVPRRDSALVKIIPHGTTIDPFFKMVVKGLFTHKKKSVRNALISSVDCTGFSRELLRSFPIPHANKKVWSLTLDELQDLMDVLQAEEFLCSHPDTHQ